MPTVTDFIDAAYEAEMGASQMSEKEAQATPPAPTPKPPSRFLSNNPWMRGARAAAGIGGGIVIANAINDMYEKARRSVGREGSFKKLVMDHPDVVERDPAYAKKVYDSLFRNSPSMAKDPLVAAHFLRSAIERKKLGDDLEGLDPMTIKSVVDLDRSKTTPARVPLDIFAKGMGDTLGKD